ncbi:MAG: 50S ribosomal protein L1 [Anaerolineae bacterium]
MKGPKNRRAALEQVDRQQHYSPEEALARLRSAAYAKFDETVELHMSLGVDPRHADQQVRGLVSLPHGTGRSVRVIVFAEGDAARAALDAGADEVGGADLATRVKEGWFDFDVVVAAQPMMRVVGKLGPVLGPRGLMPSPKSGTVVPDQDVSRVVEESKAGRIEFRVDKTSNLHLPIGKLSFTDEQLLDNLGAAVDAIVRARPPAVKGTFIKNAVVTSTMGPGLKLDVAAAMALAAQSG